MKKTIHTDTNHVMMIVSMTKKEAMELNLDGFSSYTHFYKVYNFDEDGCVFFYLAKGHKHAEREIVGWYSNTKLMWSGFGKNFKEVISGLQRDGWLYA